MSDRKPIIGIARSKIGTFFGVLLLIYLALKVFPNIGVEPIAGKVIEATSAETFYEVTIPSNWFDNYSKQTAENLVSDFMKLGIDSQIQKMVEGAKTAPKLSVEIYQDKVEGEKDLAWVVKFIITTPELGMEKSKEIVAFVGSNFGEHVKKYAR